MEETKQRDDAMTNRNVAYSDSICWACEQPVRCRCTRQLRTHTPEAEHERRMQALEAQLKELKEEFVDFRTFIYRLVESAIGKQS